MTVACFFAGWPGAGPCDGRLTRAHLVPQQLLKRTWNQREDLREQAKAEGRTLREVLWDPRCWVPCCGGPMGNGGHHGMLDQSRKLRIPREKLPPGVEEFAAELGLLWWLDREYGEAVSAA